MIIYRAIEKIIYDTGEEVFLHVAPVNSVGFPEAYRASLRVPASSPAWSAPLFDPVNGDVELAGNGATVKDALAALRRVLGRYFD